MIVLLMSLCHWNIGYLITVGSVLERFWMCPKSFFKANTCDFLLSIDTLHMFPWYSILYSELNVAKHIDSNELVSGHSL